MELIDTHCHLDFDQFAGREAAVLAAAAERGVTRFVTVGTSIAGSQRGVELAQQFANVWATVGLHPSDAVDPLDAPLLQTLRESARQPRVVAIGEIGLDLYHAENPPLTQQQDAFAAQLALAAELDLPVIVHTRQAQSQTLAMLAEAQRERSELPAVIHCFEGDLAFARAVLDLGLHISFTATITYPKNEALREVVRYVPEGRFILETDAPFLPPQSRRGQPNDPGTTRDVAELVAELRGSTVAEIAAQTTTTAEAFFKLAERA